MLPAFGACLLGSLNLAAFVTDAYTPNAKIDIEELKKTVKIAVKGLNEVLDEGIPLHPLKEQQECAANWRQIGLGFLGLGDMLIKMRITYGSPEAIKLCDEIGGLIARTAIEESALLAKEYGPYPKYNKLVLDSNFFKAHETPELRELVEKYGLRNSQLLTCAPTGSLSNVLGVSSGLEPIFALQYTRKTQSLHGEDVFYTEYPKVINELGNTMVYGDEYPAYVITAEQIPYLNRIKMQAIWQNHIDASISSTVNLPNSATVEDIEDLYMEAWKQGLKGITVYRAGCEREGILVEDKPAVKPAPVTTATTSTYKAENDLPWGTVLKVRDDLMGIKTKITNGCGQGFHLQAFYDEEEGRIWETFCNLSGPGGYSVATLMW